MRALISLCAAALLFAAGCSKTNDATHDSTAPPPPADQSATPSTMPPDQPTPGSPSDNTAPPPTDEQSTPPDQQPPQPQPQ